MANAAHRGMGRSKYTTEERVRMLEQADYDSPWKEMLEGYFEEFMAFFFPEIAADIEWELGYQFLDKELQQVVRDAELGRRVADKLVKVARKGSHDDL